MRMKYDGVRSMADRRIWVLFAGVALCTLGGIGPAGAQTVVNTTASVDNNGAAAVFGTNSVTINSGASVNFVNTNAITVPNVFTGAGRIIIQGTGTTTLTGANSFTGGVTLNAGTLAAGSNAAFGNNSVSTANGTTIQAGAAGLSLTNGIVLGAGTTTVDTQANSLTLGGSIVGGSTANLTKIGSGTLILTSSSTYSGTTTISAGTLQVGNGGTTGSLATGPLVNNGALAFNRSSTLFVSNVISGSGSLSVTGAGTIVLIGANTYSGVTTIAAGSVLQAGGGSSTGTMGSGAVVNNGTLVLARSDTMTVANAISGSGKLTKASAGTSILTGSNTYSGSTTIATGVLQVGAGGTSGSLGTGDVINNSALVFNRSDTVTAANAISGTGSLTQNGPGKLVLNGISTYTGLTTAAAGELQIGDASTPTASIAGSVQVNSGATLSGYGSIGGVLVNRGIVSLGSAATLSVAGVYFSDASSRVVLQVTPTAASLLKVGGQATLAGNLTLVYAPGVYTAATFPLVQAGSVSGTFATTTESGSTPNALVRTVSYSATGATLTLTDPLVGSVVNNGTVTLTRADTFTSTSAISGSGSLVQNGSGKLILNGVNTYTGGTTVASGELQIGDESRPTASIAGNVAVNAGGTLSGHGSIGGDVTNNGIVSPGGSVGTLTIAGAYASTAASQLLVQVTPTGASLLKVGGTAALAGNLTLTYAPGIYRVSAFPIVQAGSVTGTFASVTETGSVPTNVTRSVGYSPTGVTLTLARGAVVVGPADGALFGSVQTTLATGGHSVLGLLLDRKADPVDEVCVAPGAAAPQGAGDLCRKGGWVRAFGQFAQVNGQDGNPGFHSHGGGFMAGLGRPIAGGTFGVAGGYQRTDLGDSAGGDAQADTLRLAAYGARAFGPVVLSGAANYGWSRVGSQRNTGPFIAKAAYNVQEIDAGLQAAAPLRLGAATLTPKAGLRLVELLQDGFSETDAGVFGVTGHAHNVDSLQPFVGAALSRTADWQGGTLTPELRVGVRHELLDVARSVDVRSVTGFDFVAASTTIGRDVVSAGAGMTFLRAGRLAVSANYDADFVREMVAQTVSLGAHLRF